MFRWNCWAELKTPRLQFSIIDKLNYNLLNLFYEISTSTSPEESSDVTPSKLCTDSGF